MTMQPTFVYDFMYLLIITLHLRNNNMSLTLALVITHPDILALLASKNWQHIKIYRLWVVPFCKTTEGGYKRSQFEFDMWKVLISSTKLSLNLLKVFLVLPNNPLTLNFVDNCTVDTLHQLFLDLTNWSFQTTAGINNFRNWYWMC